MPVDTPALWAAMYHSVGDRADDPYHVTVTPAVWSASCAGCAHAGCSASAWPGCCGPARRAAAPAWWV